MMRYKGYTAWTTCDPITGEYTGKVSDLVTFRGENKKEARKDFYRVVDEYLDLFEQKESSIKCSPEEPTILGGEKVIVQIALDKKVWLQGKFLADYYQYEAFAKLVERLICETALEKCLFIPQLSSDEPNRGPKIKNFPRLQDNPREHLRNTMEYKGYRAHIKYQHFRKNFYGEVQNLIHFEGTSVEALKSRFHTAIDQYLQQKALEERKLDEISNFQPSDESVLVSGDTVTTTVKIEKSDWIKAITLGEDHQYTSFSEVVRSAITFMYSFSALVVDYVLDATRKQEELEAVESKPDEKTP